MHAAPPAPTLVRVARALAAGAASVDDLRTSFAASTVYCERTDRQGFSALGAPGAGVVPAFTSAEQLAIARGPVPWFSLLGADLLDLLPVGYDILLDLGGATPLRLRLVDGRLTAVTAVDGPSGRSLVPVGPVGAPASGSPAAGLLRAVGDAAVGLRYGRPHSLPFARPGGRPRWGWDTWRRWSDHRDLGWVSVQLVASATRAGTGAATAWRAWRRTAYSVFGRDTGTRPPGPQPRAEAGPTPRARRHGGPAGPAAVSGPAGDPARHDPRSGEGPRRAGGGATPRTTGPGERPPNTSARVVAPVRGSRHPAVEVWRTNLHTPPRSARPARVWTGRGSNPLSRATVAASLPTDEQEVRGVVLRSGPPVAEEPEPDPGRSR